MKTKIKHRSLCRGKFVVHLIWFGLFVHPFSHICNTGHDSYRLQFV